MTKKEYIILFLSLAFLLSVIAIGLLFLYPGKEEKDINETGKLFEYVKTPPVKTPEDQDSSIFVIKPRASEEVRQRLLERSQENQSTLPTKQGNLLSQPGSPAGTQKSPQKSPQKYHTPIPSTTPSPPQKIKKTYTRSIKKQSVQKPSVKPIPYIATSEKVYWIQLLATASKRRVLQARQDLQSFHIHSLIRLQENKTKLLYRLRVGPFPHEGEANQAMNWILEGKAFSDAYILQEK